MKRNGSNTVPEGFAKGGSLRKMAAPLTWKACRWSAAARMLPDFIIIGAQKGGTTSLCSHLFQHPQILAARRKEIHFFDAPEFAHGLGWYRAHFPLELKRRSGRANARAITGEASPFYLFHPHAHQRVFDVVPQVKLIVMLRDPVDRALSHYNHQVRKGREPLEFEQAIRAEDERLAGEKARMLADDSYYSHNYWAYSYLARGRYAEQIDTWRSVFPAEQMLIINSEEFFRDPRTQFGETLDFLGLDHFDLGAYGKQNAGRYDSIPAQLRHDLMLEFKPHNERVYALTGRDFGWGD